MILASAAKESFTKNCSAEREHKMVQYRLLVEQLVANPTHLALPVSRVMMDEDGRVGDWRHVLSMCVQEETKKIIIF